MAEETEKKVDDPLLTRMQERVTNTKKSRDNKERRLKKLRNYARGKVGDDGEPGLVRANLVFSTIRSIVPNVYARTPDISIRPAPAADDDQYSAIGPFASVAEIVTSRLLKKAGLKRKAKDGVQAGMIDSVSWLKTTIQFNEAATPTSEDDAPDVVERIEELRNKIRLIEDGEAEDEEAAARDLEEQISSMTDQSGGMPVKGLSISRVLDEDVIIDPSVRQVSDYLKARWIAHRMWLPVETIERIAGRKVTHQSSKSTDDYPVEFEDFKQDIAPLYELWDRGASKVYTFLTGDPEWIREPFVPDQLSAQFYPLNPLIFFEIDGGYPLSAVELMQELQDEYNTTRTNYAEHRKRSLPGLIGTSDLSFKSVKKLEVAGLLDITILDTNGKSLDSVLKDAPIPRIDPALYDTSQIRADIDMVVGVQDAMRGSIHKAKTATEAEILQAGMSGRVGEMQDIVEDQIRDVAEHSLQLLLQAMDRSDVARITGAKAAQSWPEQLPVEQALELLDIEIRAGTSGKPDRAKERESWIALVPVLRELFMQILQFDQQGIDSTPLRKIAKETLRRFDERIDPDEYLPTDPQQQLQSTAPVVPGQPQPQPGVSGLVNQGPTVVPITQQ